MPEHRSTAAAAPTAAADVPSPHDRAAAPAPAPASASASGDRAASAPPAAPDAVEARRTPFHLAVVAGPDTGWCLGVTAAGRSVGRGVGDLALTDALVSRRHLQVRSRQGRVQVRDTGSVNGTRLVLPGRLSRRRRLRARWRHVPPGSRLRLGATVLELRSRPHDLPSAPAGVEAGRTPRTDPLRWLMPLMMPVAMLPLLVAGSAGPWRWLALVLPLVLVTLTLARHRHERRRAEPAPRGRTRRTIGSGPDPAAVLLAAAAGAPPPRPTPKPEVSLLEPRAGARMSRDGPSGRRRQPRLRLEDGDRVALVGRGEDIASTARWITAQLAGAAPGERDERAPWRVVVVGPDSPAPREEPQAPTVHVVLAGRQDRVPPWCTRVVPVPVLVQGLSRRWADTLAHLRTTDATAAALPATVALADLIGPIDDLAARWAQPPPGLTVPLGVAADGVVDLDLVGDGPHALVAGTTGSGKSELLLCWLLGLAVRYPPGDLQLVLVDYKGGATFTPLTGLPHTAGVLTDLDPAATSRALTSLQAEVRRRERLLADASARDLAAHVAAAGGAPRPPRLLVVVDEYRALADEHPEVLAALVRLAAQGRSLGVHLVLATQRPGGAVSADMRANLTVRLCLRVLEPADSADVLGTPDAAALPALPGRALLRTTGLRTLQLPCSGPGPGLPRTVVAAADRAWRSGHGSAVLPRPWAPPLPVEIGPAALPHEPGTATGDAGLALALRDLPEEQRLGTWTWTTPALLVTGGPGTGRTETLRTAVAQALAAGMPVHVVAAHPARFGDLSGPSLGTVVGADDPRRVARLLDLLPAADPAQHQLLVVDDVDAVCDHLELTGPGRGVPVLAGLLRDARRSGVRVALSGPPSLAGARWTEAVRTRLVLAPRDGTEALLSGVPREHLAPPRPGRGVLLEPGRATAVQVARSGGAALPGAPHPGVLRLAALPGEVTTAQLVAAAHPGAAGPAGADSFAIGLGGDDGGPVGVPAGAGDHLLVLGPPGSGRSTALATAAGRLRGTGRTVVEPAPGRGLTTPAPRTVLVLDDVDRWPADDLAAVGTLLQGRPDLTVLAAATTDAAAAAYRGPLATWRGSATLLILRPGQGPTAQVTSVALAPALDPTRPFHAGLGVLVRAGRAVPVQVAAP